MANLAKLEKQEPEPDFIQTVEIDYTPPPPPVAPIDRRVLTFDEEPVYAPDTDIALIPALTF